jgi:hypothetical protein
MNILKKVFNLFGSKSELKEETRELQVEAKVERSPRVATENDTEYLIAFHLKKWMDEGKIKQYRHLKEFITSAAQADNIMVEELYTYTYTANDKINKLSRHCKFFSYKFPKESVEVIDWMRSLVNK